MRETLRHRGPDGEGVFLSEDARVGLGHRRLSILDPSGGAQPMFGACGESLVFNGEIYNYPALRAELEHDGVQFTTCCDTEVILHLYARYGDECLAHLNGMFAFALWDPRKERMLLARDRLGEKPLYWADTGGRLIFGSEIKALLEHPSVRPAVNVRAVAPYLANLVTSSPDTLFRGVQKLPPGCMATCDRKGVRVSRYWNLFAPRAWTTLTLDESASEVRRMLDRSINERLMSDVPVGVLLSGGLDSTTLVALLHERSINLATFSVGFDDHPELDERAEARRAAAFFGTEHHEVNVTQKDALAFLSRLVHHQDEPLADPVCLPLHFVCDLARRNQVKVVLAGEGADELFWGYPRYAEILGRWRQVRAILALPRSARRAAAAVLGWGRHPHVKDFLDGVTSRRLLPAHFPLGLSSREIKLLLGSDDHPFSLGWEPSNHGVTGGDPLTEWGFDTQEYEFGLRLPELLLMRIDRFSMANGVEARVPFLAPDLVEFVYRLPLSHKLHDGMSKVVLRKAIADIVPEWVLTRRKQGFGAPVASWLDSQLGDVFRSLLAEDAIREYFDAEVLATWLNCQRGRTGIWPVLNFALWHIQWIEGRSTDPIVFESAA